LTSLKVGLFYFARPVKNRFKVLLVPHNDIYSSKIYQFISDHYNPDIKEIVVLGINHSDLGPVIISGDHDYSIQNIIPLVRQIYPDAQISPYIFRPSRDIPQLLSFSNQIKEKYGQDSLLIITSVDFSHYTSRSESDRFDRETINAIKNRDYNQLISWGPEHTDCPDCLIISSEFGNNFNLISSEYFEGTSYFFGIFD